MESRCTHQAPHFRGWNWWFSHQTVGFLVGGMIVALRVTNGLSSASEFVVFVTFLAQVRFF